MVSQPLLPEEPKEPMWLYLPASADLLRSDGFASLRRIHKEVKSEKEWHLRFVKEQRLLGKTRR